MKRHRQLNLTILSLFWVLLGFGSIRGFTQDPAVIPKSEDSLVTFLQTWPKDTVYVRALRPYALIQINKHANYKKADSIALVIRQLSEKLNYGRGMYFHYLIKAIIANQKSEAEKSISYFKSGLEIVKKYKLSSTLEEASLNNIAVGYEQLGNRDKALSYALQAIQVQEKPNYPKQWLDAAPYGIVSTIYKLKKQWKEAERYASLAYSISEKKQDKIGMAIQKNRLGNILDDQGETEAALREYLIGLRWAEDAEYPLLQTDLLDNIGRMLVLQKRYKEAEMYLRKNEAICLNMESPEALKSAYHSLGDLFKVQKKYDQAVPYFLKAYEKAKLGQDNLDLYTTSSSLSEVYALLGDYPNAYQYLLAAKKANDLVFDESSHEKMQELLTKYETEKKESAIRQLEWEKKQATTRLWMLSLLGVFLLVILYLFFRNYHSRQRIQALEATQKIRNRISADLHDEIGSTLSSISILSEILAVQPQASSNPEMMLQISQDARKVIEKMDEIIWSINPKNDEFLNLEARLKSYAVPLLENKGIGFVFQFSEELERQNIPMEKRRDVYLIMKEAIINAIKYSQCQNLRVEGTIEEQRIVLSVSDDGVGFDPLHDNARNGMRNMKIRAEALGGTLTVRSDSHRQTKVQLEIKLD